MVHRMLGVKMGTGGSSGFACEWPARPGTGAMLGAQLSMGASSSPLRMKNA